MDEKLLLKAVVLAGEIMLSSGAEVSRVENTMQFMLRRSNCEVTEAVAHNRYHFERDHVKHGYAATGMKVNAYRYDGVALFNKSTTEFFHNSLALIRPEICFFFIDREYM